MIAALWGQKHLNGPDSNRSELAALAVWYHGPPETAAPGGWESTPCFPPI